MKISEKKNVNKEKCGLTQKLAFGGSCKQFYCLSLLLRTDNQNSALCGANYSQHAMYFLQILRCYNAFIRILHVIGRQKLKQKQLKTQTNRVFSITQTHSVMPHRRHPVIQAKLLAMHVSSHDSVRGNSDEIPLGYPRSKQSLRRRSFQ